MSNKTINQALEGLYKGLGGDPSALADNSTCSDYIADLESAIKGAASGAQIDDSAPSETKVYSSAKTEELIGSIETLPTVEAADIGDVLTVVSDGESGAEWGKSALVIPDNVAIFTATTKTSSSVTLDNGKMLVDLKNAILANKVVAIIYNNRTHILSGDEFMPSAPTKTQFSCVVVKGSNVYLSVLSSQIVTASEIELNTNLLSFAEKQLTLTT